VVFQGVVPFAAIHKTRGSGSGAKVEIGCNDFQGTDLLRRLLHGLVAMGLKIASSFNATQKAAATRSFSVAL